MHLRYNQKFLGYSIYIGGDSLHQNKIGFSQEVLVMVFIAKIAKQMSQRPKTLQSL
jgi:hypothetical protein